MPLVTAIFCTLILTGCTVPFTFGQSNTPAAITALSQPQAEVYLDSQDIGKTPITKKSVKPGTYQVTFRTSQASWAKFVTFSGGTDSYINRQFINGENNSIGSVIVFEKGNGLAILGSPENAQITVDNNIAGNLPLYLPNIAAGYHTVMVSAQNFTNTSQQINVNANLKTVAYIDLGKGTGQAATPVPVATTLPTAKKATVASPEGWMRIRTQPSTQSTELFRVNNGDSLAVLDQSAGWTQVKTIDGKIGWGYTQYLRIQ